LFPFPIVSIPIWICNFCFWMELPPSLLISCFLDFGLTTLFPSCNFCLACHVSLWCLIFIFRFCFCFVSNLSQFRFWSSSFLSSRFVWRFSLNLVI
jgi:hypothetical protein